MFLKEKVVKTRKKLPLKQFTSFQLKPHTPEIITMAFLVLSPVVAQAYVPVFEQDIEHTPAVRERTDSVSSISSVESVRASGFKPMRLQQ